MKKLSLFLTALMLWVVPLALFAAAPGDVLINEIAWMGSTTSANDEWLELHNNTNQPIDLGGWFLTSADGAPNIPLKGTINAGEFYLLERTNDQSVLNVSANKIYKGAMGNNGEDILLYDKSSNLIDQANFSSGWVFGDNNTKQTAERVAATSWQTSQRPNGTPKAQNSQGIIVKTASYDEKEKYLLIKEKKFGNDVAVASVANDQLDASNPLGLFLMVGGMVLIAGAGVIFLKLKNKF